MDDNDIRVPAAYVQQPTLPVVPPPPVPVSQRRGFSGWAVVAAALLGGVIGAGLVAGALYAVTGGFAAQGTAPVVRRMAGPVNLVTTQTVQPDEGVAAKVTPSVVNISIEKSVTNPFTGQTGVQAVGNGSGVIIRPDGYVLTNNHVVEGADRILVSVGLENKPAKVIGTDAVTDIAVIKVDATGLTAADLGDSDTLVVGEQVIAVGSPFGLDHTVTSGIISALHRSDTGQTYTNLIQTDAAINPGNSGGALADSAGKVIGINTLIQTGGAAQSAGIGFAIPIKLASLVADQLIATGKATHAFLGVSMQTLDSQLAAQLKIKLQAGAVVQDVVKGSPADKAGIKKGDVITGVDGQPVQTSQDVISVMRLHKVGDTVKVEVNRGGKQMTVSATLSEAPAG